MKYRYLFIVFSVAVCLTTISCNIYSSFGSVSSDEDRREEALKCLHNEDWDCAIAQYNAIGDGQEKSRRLCTVYMAKAGLSLNTFVNLFASSSSDVTKMMGTLANGLVPWDVTKTEDVTQAKTNCDAYVTSVTAAGSESDFAVLLKSLSRFMECALLMAKTDVLVGSDENDTGCSAAGNGDGDITSADIAQNANGTGKGMCKTDALTCVTDMSQISSSELGGAELGNMTDVYDGLPAALKNTGAGTAALRSAIVSTL